jgi:DNA-binding NtrC family response regulator
MRVLVVDDDPVTQRMLKAQLEKMSYDVTVSGDGEDALDVWQSDPFPVVILDWMLPNLDGLGFARRVRAHPRGDECVIVVITSRDGVSDLNRVLDAGADDYIVKPVNADVFATRMTIAARQYRALVARNRAERAHRSSEMQVTSIVSNAPILVLGIDRAGRITIARGREFEQSSMGNGLIENRQLTDVLPRATDIHRDMQRAMRGQAFGAIRTLLGRTWDIWYAPHLDASGTIDGVTATATDISERIQAEERLERTVSELSAERDEIRALFQRTRSGVVIVDHEDRVTFFNSLARSMLAMPAESLGMLWSEAFNISALDKEILFSSLTADEQDRETLHLEVRRKPGAVQYLQFELIDAPQVVGKSVFFIYDQSDVIELRRHVEDQQQQGLLIGRGNAIQLLHHRLRDSAQVEWTVLVEGPPGAGRKSAARQLHDYSRRRNAPFTVIDCAFVSEVALLDWWMGESASPPFIDRQSNGTVFISGIDSLSANGQSGLLRYLEDREFNPESVAASDAFRVLVGARRSLADAVEKGDFLSSLFARLRMTRVRVPALRERREDIPALTMHFLERWALLAGRSVPELDKDAIHLLLQYRWPGNVQELSQVVEHMLVASGGDHIRIEHLPPELTHALSSPDAHTSLDERDQILRALERAGGNRKKAATLLGVSRATLYRRLDKLGIMQEQI